jgi:hypothetical protein
MTELDELSSLAQVSLIAERFEDASKYIEELIKRKKDDLTKDEKNTFYNSFKFNNLTFKDVKHRESTALVFCMNKNYNTLKRLTKIKYALVDFSDKSYLRNNTEEELPYEDEEDYKFQRYMNSVAGQRRMFQLFYMTERRKIYERKISQLFQKAKSIWIE